MSVAPAIVANAAQAVVAARVALIEASVLKVGQVLEALVVGTGADGTTTLKIGDQMVAARLPHFTMAPGSAVQLQVKVAGAAPQLQVLSVQLQGREASAAGAAPLRRTPDPTAALAKMDSPQGFVGKGSQIGSAARLEGAMPARPSAPTSGEPAVSRSGAEAPVQQRGVVVPAAQAVASAAQIRPVPVAPAAEAMVAVTGVATPTPAAKAPSFAPAVVGDGAEAAAPNSLLLAQAAPRSPASAADLPRLAQPPAPRAASQPVPLPATPQAALAQMLPDALGRQDSAGPLLVSLAAAVRLPAVLPEPVLRAALGVLAQRIVVSDGQVQAGDLEQAVARSGVTLEASLLRGEAQPRDAKAGLLALREALTKWLGGAPAPAIAGRVPASPPIKGLPLRAMPVEMPPLPDAARDVGRVLHEQADAAVSRLKLMQLASLPDADPGRPSATALRLELPFLVGHELVMAQMQVGPDGTRRERREGKRGWTMRFALNSSMTGEVGAEIGLLGKAVSVSLWAAEPETVAAMNEALPELSGALAAAGLSPGAVKIRHGVPAASARSATGRLLDSVS